MKLIECVPNFSEGRDRAVIDTITGVISDTPGAMLLDVDPGAATNRTVVTIAGPPDAVLEAAFRAIAQAAESIDMSRHSGEHARMGATDVCPFVPMQGATMEDCVELARLLGQRVGEELGIPVYLYGSAASRPERRRLPDIRQGEYEALPEIAWNINLNTRERKLANRIAAELRETGKPKRDAQRKFVRDADGKVLRVPGRFTELQGGGWYIEEYGRAQISFNLMNYKVTSIHDVFDACREEAAKVGVRVTGSELVGLIPLDALLAAGDHYLTKQGRTTGVPEAERIHTAVLSLGLAELGPFDPREKIIEYRYRGAPTGLQAMRLFEFVEELSSDSPAPGGGSVAALCGALSAALCSMVAALTWSKKGMEDARPAMREIGERSQELADWFVGAVDRDTEAFNAVIAARRLPKKTEEEKKARLEAIELANQAATRVPLEVLERTLAALESSGRVARDGNPASVSDAGVAGACALAAAEGAALNVRINLPSITDAEVAAEIDSAQTELLARAHLLADDVRRAVDDVL
jgi:glutamate formiminotransferase/formiminotetrahydrofolate cyclodeaminase